MAQQYEIGKHATTVCTSSNRTVVTYQETQVVIFDDQAITLDSGGWKTNTTKTRMNQTANQFGLGFSVYQENFEWFVSTPSGVTIHFEDGMNFPR